MLISIKRMMIINIYHNTRTLMMTLIVVFQNSNRNDVTISLKIQAYYNNNTINKMKRHIVCGNNSSMNNEKL